MGVKEIVDLLVSHFMIRWVDSMGVGFQGIFWRPFRRQKTSLCVEVSVAAAAIEPPGRISRRDGLSRSECSSGPEIELAEGRHSC